MWYQHLFPFPWKMMSLSFYVDFSEFPSFPCSFIEISLSVPALSPVP